MTDDQWTLWHGWQFEKLKFYFQSPLPCVVACDAVADAAATVKVNNWNWTSASSAGEYLIPTVNTDFCPTMDGTWGSFIGTTLNCEEICRTRAALIDCRHPRPVSYWFFSIPEKLPLTSIGQLRMSLLPPPCIDINRHCRSIQWSLITNRCNRSGGSLSIQSLPPPLLHISRAQHVSLCQSEESPPTESCNSCSWPSTKDCFSMAKGKQSIGKSNLGGLWPNFISLTRPQLVSFASHMETNLSGPRQTKECWEEELNSTLSCPRGVKGQVMMKMRRMTMMMMEY